MKKNQDNSKHSKRPIKSTPGNQIPAPSDYEDPTGSEENISTPKNSGYDEKQPPSKPRS